MARFGITMGDPCGIGPEIIVKALKTRAEYIDSCIVFGNGAMLEHYGKELGLTNPVCVIQNLEEAKEGMVNVFDPLPIERAEIPVGRVSKVGGDCAFQYVTAAIKAALNKNITSVVTAPLNKEALHSAGHLYAGHTEIFGEMVPGDSYAMLLWSDKLKAIHATTHISMKKMCETISKQRNMDVIRLAHQTLTKVGYEKPRIAVAGLNPHAGENGIFGDEEQREIEPAVKECREKGIDVSGPIAPDTVFLRAYKGEFDIVVAQYHDQGHIPLKLLAFDSGVNITVGLDVVRTSVDHGTAFDIAGKGIAREDSLLRAIEIGGKL